MSFQSDLKAALGLSESASNAQILWKLEEQLGGSATSSVEAASLVGDDPQEQFHLLAEQTSKVLGISLADAYCRVSSEAPTLAQRARERAWLT